MSNGATMGFFGRAAVFDPLPASSEEDRLERGVRFFPEAVDGVSGGIENFFCFDGRRAHAADVERGVFADELEGMHEGNIRGGRR